MSDDRAPRPHPFIDKPATVEDCQADRQAAQDRKAEAVSHAFGISVAPDESSSD